MKPTKYDSIDDLEADLMKMTAEVRRLRMQQSSDIDNHSSAADIGMQIRTPRQEVYDNAVSPAEKLFRTHEQQVKRSKSRPQTGCTEALSSAKHEFSVLASLTNSTMDQIRHQIRDPEKEKPRKPSYAQILAQRESKQQTLLDETSLMRGEVKRGDDLDIAKPIHLSIQGDDFDGEISVRHYDADVSHAAFHVGRPEHPSSSSVLVHAKSGPPVSTETRLEKRRQRKELPFDWKNVRVDGKPQQQQPLTPRRSNVDLKTNDKSPQKDFKSVDRQSAKTLGSKASSYALPTAASKRRAAVVGTASPISHKPSRSVPSVKTLWQNPEITVKSTGVISSPSAEDASSHPSCAKDGRGRLHDPAIIDHQVRIGLMGTTGSEVPASPSRLPRPVKRDGDGDGPIGGPAQNNEVSAQNVDYSSVQAFASVVGTGKRASILAPIARRISSADAPASKADRNLASQTGVECAQQDEDDDDICSSDPADSVIHKDSASSSESTNAFANSTDVADVVLDQSNTGSPDLLKHELRIEPTNQPTPVGSLRADAPAFVPGFERMTHTTVKDSGIYNWQDPLWVPDYKWESMSYEEKREVVEKRRGRGLSNVSSTTPTAASTSTDFSTPITLDPQGNIVAPRWTNRRTVKTLRTLGRAPLPYLGTPMTDYASNSSTGSSPQKGWTVGSAEPGWKYGWRGGDGKEISFSGYGPDAERNPYSPFNFRSYEESPSNRFGIAAVQGHGKGMQEWALKNGYDRIPCPNFEIGRATENITGPENPMGWCSACLPHRAHVYGSLF